MLSNHPAVAAGWVQTQFLTHQEAEPSRVQVGTATNHAVPGKATQLPSYIGQDINWKEKIGWVKQDIKKEKSQYNIRNLSKDHRLRSWLKM